ncbi:hypothetical protein KR044_001406 [Drosophila immigrans]|nr:hypothetical protein KR044_001406 [Drosophila immigrans]
MLQAASWLSLYKCRETMQPINESLLANRVEINALSNMFKLFLLLALCAAFAYAAPSLSSLSGLSGHSGLSSLSSVPILSSATSYHGHGWPQAVQVVRPVWTPHTIVRPIIHGNLGYGYGHGWL